MSSVRSVRRLRKGSLARQVGCVGAMLLCLISVDPAALATPGAQLWAKRYNGPANLYDEANALAVGADGTKVFSTGFSRGSTSSNDYATVAYDASTGDRLWARRYNGPGNAIDEAEALALSPGGSSVFVTGFSFGSASRFDYATVAYDASTGATLWVKRYDRSDDEARALEVSPDGTTVFVTGGSYGSATSLDYATVAYDASTGAKLWARRYNGPLSSQDEANALDVSADSSSVFVTGYSYGLTQSADYATVAYDASTGAKLWVSRYREPSNENEEPAGAQAVAVSPDGSSVFVTGRNRSTTTANDYATVAYEAATGAKLWARRYSPAADSQDAASALVVSPDGSRVFVTGSSSGSSGLSDYATVGYDASTGAKLWARRYNGPGNHLDFA
jgi:WD40 repeat protein